MAIAILGLPTNLGIPRPQTRPAPAALRAQGLLDRLQATGETVRDLGDLPVPRGEEIERGEPLLRAVLRVARRQAGILRRVLRTGALPVTLGGDHSTSLGTLLGLAGAGLDFDVVWVDAHADFNTPQTSPTGNPHGMVLALAGGLTPYLPRAVPPHRVHILGARDLDPGERELIARHGLKVYTPEETLDRLEAIVAGLGPRVFLSFDVDSLRPEVAPGVRTPVPGGFTLEEALEVVTAVVRSRELVAVDLVEYDPDLDREGRTGTAALTVLERILATRRAALETSATARD
ncbi:MAG: arginase [Bacillota bacterium]